MKPAFFAALVFVAACGSSEPPKSVTVLPLPTIPTQATAEAVLPQPTATPKGDTAPEVLASGKVTVVHFFASWCAPCWKSLPELDAFYAKHGGRVAVVGVGEDDDESDMRSFVAARHASFTILWDAAKAKASRWKPTALPTTYVVDKRGMLRFTHAGYTTDTTSMLDTEVESLLAEP